MHSAVLESFDKSDFLNFVQAVSEIWESDALFSGRGYLSEDLSVCFILPVSSFEVTGEESIRGLREFVSADDKEAYGYLSYDLGLILKGISTDKKLTGQPGLFKKYACYARHKNGRLTIESDEPDIIEKAVIAYESYSRKTFERFSSSVACNMSTMSISKKRSRLLNI